MKSKVSPRVAKSASSLWLALLVCSSLSWISISGMCTINIWLQATFALSIVEPFSSVHLIPAKWVLLLTINYLLKKTGRLQLFLCRRLIPEPISSLLRMSMLLPVFYFTSYCDSLLLERLTVWWWGGRGTHISLINDMCVPNVAVISSLAS